jgi:translation initiation factor 2B subunit (eIF-2B alpha/beta/delta family)
MQETPMTYQVRIKAIARDNISGAQRITENVIALVLDMFGSRKLTSSETEQRLTDTAREIISGQPAIAPLFNLFDALFQSLDQIADSEPAGPAVCRAARHFARAMAQHTGQIAVHLGRLVRKDDVVLTHSASAAVGEGLRYCWTKGRRFSVICTESRPACEGASMARELARRKIPTWLVADSQAFALLHGETEFTGKPTLVVVGADSVSPYGVTNKTGTLGLAVAARAWSVPFYVLAGRAKLLPASYPVQSAIQQKPAGEILRSPPKGLTIVNRYFDITPLPYLTAVVTEGGPRTHRQLTAQLRELKPHRALKRIVQEEI